MVLVSDIRLILATFGLVLIAAAGTAFGQTANLEVTAQVDATCTLNGNTLAFGTYTATAADPTESDATISYNCTPGTSITLSLNGGGSGQVASRAMAGPGGATLDYQLYTDDALSDVWGEGSTDGVTVASTTGSLETRTVYGAIPTGQQAAAGAYSDTVLITLAINPQ